MELVRLEQTIDRIFDGPGPEKLQPFALPPAAGAELRLTLAPGCELLACEYPVSSYYTTWKAGQDPVWPAAQPQYVALLRRDYVVRRFELTAPQYKLLHAIAAGATLDQAVAMTADDMIEENLDALTTEIRAWFATWGASGFFATAEPTRTRPE